MLYLLKVLVSALVIVGVMELPKRGGTLWGGVLASLPLTSLLAFLWLVLPSLSLFVALPLALCIMIVCFLVMMGVLKRFGILI